MAPVSMQYILNHNIQHKRTIINSKNSERYFISLQSHNMHKNQPKTDGNYQDIHQYQNFDGPNHYEELQHDRPSKHNRAEKSPKSGKGRCIAVIIAVVALLVSVAVAVTVILLVMNKGEGTKM